MLILHMYVYMCMYMQCTCMYMYVHMYVTASAVAVAGLVLSVVNTCCLVALAVLFVKTFMLTKIKPIN